jgi:hypothetical protein
MKCWGYLLCALLVLNSPASAADQSAAVKLAIGSWLAEDELVFGETGYAYNHGGLTLEGALYYRTYEHVLTPFVGVVYRFDDMPGGTRDESSSRLNVKNVLIEAGIGKTLQAGHSKMDLSIGLGYCIRDLEVEGGAVNLLYVDADGAAFIGGVAINFPFFDRVDATFAYRIVYNAGGTEDGNYGWIDYEFTLADIHHLFSFGLSYYP